MTRLRLDNGDELDVAQDMGPSGESQVIDVATRVPLSQRFLNDGAADLSSLFGLTRRTALATMFVRQADVLRVLDDASDLQDSLERAAATHDLHGSTIDEALRRVSRFRRDRVGLLRRGGLGKWQTAHDRLRMAEAEADSAQDKYEQLNSLLTRKYRAELDLHELSTEVKALENHEAERLRHERWTVVRAAEDRLKKASSLHRDLRNLTVPPDIDSRLVNNIHQALVRFDARPSAPPELEGSTSLELERRLRELPTAEAGDTKPAQHLVTAHDEWANARQLRLAHEQARPPIPEPDGPPVDGARLREMADSLERPLPEVNAGLEQELQDLKGQVRTAERVDASAPSPKEGRSRGLIIAGVGVSIVGAAALLFMPPAGLLFLVAGLATILVGVLNRGRDDRSANAQEGPTAPSETIVRMAHLEGLLQAQRETRAKAEEQRRETGRQLEELGLPVDPNKLRILADEGDKATLARVLLDDWRARLKSLEEAEGFLETELKSAFSTFVNAADLQDLESAFARYVEDCGRRAQVAQQAARRDDLQQLLNKRLAMEKSRSEAIARRNKVEDELRELARSVDWKGESIDELARVLEAWLRTEELNAKVRTQAAELRARLDQVLDGRTIDELEKEIGALREEAGDPPIDPRIKLEDRNAELAALRRRLQALRDQIAELSGQCAAGEENLPEVASTLEAVARARREEQRLRQLGEDLEATEQMLKAAQEKIRVNLAPVLSAALRPWVRQVTDGRYSDVRVSTKTLELEAADSVGRYQRVNLLSHGTREQLFLLLRMGLTQYLVTSGESAPLILDDVTVQCDRERTVAVMDLLHELSEDRQIVLFTQEDEVLEWAQSSLAPPNDRLVLLERLQL